MVEGGGRGRRVTGVDVEWKNREGEKNGGKKGEGRGGKGKD